VSDFLANGRLPKPTDPSDVFPFAFLSTLETDFAVCLSFSSLSSGRNRSVRGKDGDGTNGGGRRSSDGGTS
jgi:hypothetical protein